MTTSHAAAVIVSKKRNPPTGRSEFTDEERVQIALGIVPEGSILLITFKESSCSDSVVEYKYLKFWWIVNKQSNYPLAPQTNTSFMWNSTLTKLFLQCTEER